MAENFNLIFGSQAPTTATWSDADYQKGWSTVGSTPPTAEQFDFLQNRADLKAKELNDALTPLVNANTTDNRQPSTAYSVGTIKYTPLLPTGWFLECTVAGITSAGEIVLPTTPAEKDTVVDGTVTWTIRKMGSSSGDGVPLGAIIAYSANGELPSGYLLCDGSAVSRTMFPDLFAAIGTTYGAGDGSTTFNVPDYNSAKRFAQGDTVAGTVKSAGLPNITGETGMDTQSSVSGAFYGGVSAYGQAGTGATRTILSFDASRSNSIYGASTTVQPNALTARYVIKAYDGVTPTPAEADISQMLTELTGKANINGSNMAYHKDVITTSGTYTAPATGLYKITVKGGGGGGGAGIHSSNSNSGGGGGGEGGTTIDYVMMQAGDTATVVVGAGGSGGTTSNHIGTDGGNSTVTIGVNTYTGGGGGAGREYSPGAGGSGTINGCAGGSGCHAPSGLGSPGGSGGGSGGGTITTSSDGNVGVYGGGGGGGSSASSAGKAGGAGGDGYVWFEYYTPGAN